MAHFISNTRRNADHGGREELSSVRARRPLKRRLQNCGFHVANSIQRKFVEKYLFLVQSTTGQDVFAVLTSQKWRALRTFFNAILPALKKKGEAEKKRKKGRKLEDERKQEKDERRQKTKQEDRTRNKEIGNEEKWKKMSQYHKRMRFYC